MEESANERIENHQLQWYGHVRWMDGWMRRDGQIYCCIGLQRAEENGVGLEHHGDLEYRG